jgi:hypothetical protein
MQEPTIQSEGQTDDLDETRQTQTSDEQLRLSIQSESQTDDLDKTRQTQTSDEQPRPLVFDLVASQERTRAWLAMGLLALLVLSVIGIAVYLAFNRDDDANRELITLVWTSEVTLASSALGFYFGSKSN